VHTVASPRGRISSQVLADCEHGVVHQALIEIDALLLRSDDDVGRLPYRFDVYCGAGEELPIDE